MSKVELTEFRKRKWPKIYVKAAERPKTVKDLLPLLFKPYVLGSIGTFYRGTATFRNKECRTLQCDSGRYRSFDDIYACCKTYFPNVTPKKVMHELLVLEMPGYTGNTPLVPRLSYCNGMERIRFWYSNAPYTPVTTVPTQQGHSFWSWEELLRLLGLSLQYSEICDYINKHKTKK